MLSCWADEIVLSNISGNLILKKSIIKLSNSIKPEIQTNQVSRFFLLNFGLFFSVIVVFSLALAIKFPAFLFLLFQNVKFTILRITLLLSASEPLKFNFSISFGETCRNILCCFVSAGMAAPKDPQYIMQQCVLTAE